MKIDKFFWCTLLVLLFRSTITFGIPNCDPTLVIGSICRANIMDLHPTQMSIGMIAVVDKARGLRAMSDEHLEKYLQKHPEPTVIGPNGTLYITDHHHLGRALLMIGLQTAYCVVLENWATQGINRFWELMSAKNWVYPFDENGDGPHPFTALPNSLFGLKDDPYRSLAGAVRDNDGYDKTDEYFAEFLWANFFRTRIRIGDGQGGFDEAVDRATELAHSPDARNLPGYRPQRSLSPVLTPP